MTVGDTIKALVTAKNYLEVRLTVDDSFIEFVKETHEPGVRVFPGKRGSVSNAKTIHKMTKDTLTKDTIQRLLERFKNHLDNDSREIAQYGFEFQYAPLKRLKCAEIYGKVFIPEEKWIIGKRTHTVKAFWGVETGFPDCKFVLTDKGVIEINNLI